MNEMMMLSQLFGMGMQGMNNASNTAMGAIPLVQGMATRARMRLNPTMNYLGNIVRNQFMQANNENIFGDPYALGDMFGADSVGGAYNSYIGELMNAGSPYDSALKNLKHLSATPGPEYASSTAGMMDTAGVAPNATSQPYSTPNQRPIETPRTPKPGKGRVNTKAPMTQDRTYEPFYAAQQLAGGEGGDAAGAISGLLSNMRPNNAGLRAAGALAIPAMRMLRAFTSDPRFGLRGEGRPLATGPNAFWRKSGEGGPVKGSYAVGTTKVPETGTYKLHKNEAVVPANLNPYAKSPGAGQPLTTPYNPNAGVPAGGQSFGGAPNNVQNYLANPVTFDQRTTQGIIDRGQTGINQRAAEALRRMRDMAAGGSMSSGAYNGNVMDAEMGRLGELSSLTRDMEINSAVTNHGDMRDAAGFQWGMNRDIAGQTLAENQFRENAYNNDWQRRMAEINAAAGYGGQGSGYNMDLFNRLMQNAQGGVAFPNSFLSRAMQWQLARLMGPGAIMPQF